MVWTTAPVVDPGTDTAIAVSYDERPVPRVSQTRVVLRNFGGSTIGRRHVHQPISIALPEDIEILGEPSVESDANKRIQPSARRNGSVIALDFDFLEPGDEIRASVLSTMDAGSELSPGGSVEGARRGVESVVSVGGRMASWFTGLLESGERRAEYLRWSSLVATLLATLAAFLQVWWMSGR